MKFSGKELFELGVPQNKIKFFVGKEFSSKEELLEELKPKESVEDNTWTWVDWFFWALGPDLMPMRSYGDKITKMSRSELKRIFDSNSILINGKNFKSTDECSDEEFPIQSIIWFPKSSKSRVTWEWNL